MISKSTIKLIKSLSQKKYRLKENLFLVEGDKMVNELLQSEVKVKHLVISENFEYTREPVSENVENITQIKYDELKKISLLQNPQNSLAVCYIPQQKNFPDKLEENLYLYLDNIQDPGNLGTIIRICDWYGINNIFCSSNTVDLYNPKVIQASMGSYARIQLYECSFDQIQKLAAVNNTPIFGAFMEGENVYEQSLPTKAILVMGNEGNGISKDVENTIKNKISIPNLSTLKTKAESLNVSVATAILCSEFKRAYSK